MDEINAVLGQVPPAIRDHGTPRQKLEALWRALGFSRNGLQARVAADLAERWAPRNQSPRLPVDDPRSAQKRLEKALNGETTLSLDLSLDLIAVLPPAYRVAAKTLVFPGSQSAEPGDLMEALIADAKHDSETDLLRFSLVLCGGESKSPEELEAKAIKFEAAAKSQAAVAAHLRIQAAKKRVEVANKPLKKSEIETRAGDIDPPSYR